MPVVVSSGTNWIKKLKTINLSSNRVFWIRAVVAVLALVGATLTFMVDGTPVDPSLIETVLLALFNAAAATWLYTRK